MADDPLMGYQPGSPAAPDPLMGYQNSAASPAAQPTIQSGVLSRMGNWLVGTNDPRDPATGLHNTPADTLLPRSLSQAGSDVTDFGRVAANTFGLGDRALAGGKTYGWADYLLPGLTGTAAEQSNPNADYDKALADAQASTAAASQRIGPVASAAANMVGYGPVGELGIAGNLARLGKGAEYVPGFWRSLAGLTDEGTLAGGTAAAGHGDNVLGGALVGGGTALGLGTVGAAVNPLVRLVANPVGRATGDLSTPAAVTKATAVDEDGAWAATHQVGFDPSDVNSAYHNALTGLDAGQMRNLSPGMWDKVNGHIAANSNMSTLTANNLDAFGRDIQSAASTPADTVLAARVKSGLDQVMGTATPNWGQAPAGQTPLDLVQKARAATAAAKNASDLADMTTNLNAFKVSPAPEAQRIAREFYWDQPQGAPFQRLSNIAQTSGGGGLTGHDVARGLMDPVLEGAATMAGLGLPGVVTANAAGQLARPVLGGLMNFAKRVRTRTAINQAYPDLVPGPEYRTSYNPSFADAVKSLVLGNQAGAGR